MEKEKKKVTQNQSDASRANIAKARDVLAKKGRASRCPEGYVPTNIRTDKAIRQEMKHIAEKKGLPGGGGQAWTDAAIAYIKKETGKQFTNEFNTFYTKDK